MYLVLQYARRLLHRSLLASGCLFFLATSAHSAGILLIEDQGGFGNATSVLTSNGFNVTFTSEGSMTEIFSSSRDQ